MLSALDHDRIEAAVTKAEEGTTGDIFCVLAGEVSRYREVPLAWAAAAAIALPPIALALGLQPLAAFLGDLWDTGQGGALESQLGLALALYAAAQAVLFVAVALIVGIPAVRRRLTPQTLKRHRVAQAAQHHFTAIGANASDSTTGILIFVALDDRQVQVLADAGIHQKVGEALWAKAAGAIGAAMKAGADPTSGIVEAVGLCGAALREHYPGEANPAHAHPNRPLEI